jgi:aryl-alcohol dehydrogenase-like predicted oxidoreductase
MGMSEFYGPASEGEAVRTIARALELGVTLLDTADVYGMGENERLLGRALHGRRDEAVIATKLGQIRSADGAFVGLDGSPSYVRRACDASLKRLGVDTIDLLQLHRVDPSTPIEETVGAMSELVDAGKVRHLGLSEASAEQIRRAVTVAPIATLQSEYSVLERGVEREILPLCAELGIAFLAFAPLMRGLIARRFTAAEQLDERDTRRAGRYPRLSGEALSANLELAARVWSIADGHGVAPAAVALAWLLQRDATVIPIPGAKQVHHLEQNVAAARLELTPAELDGLDQVVGAGGAAVGERLPPRA